MEKKDDERGDSDRQATKKASAILKEEEEEEGDEEEHLRRVRQPIIIVVVQKRKRRKEINCQIGQKREREESLFCQFPFFFFAFEGIIGREKQTINNASIFTRVLFLSSCAYYCLVNLSPHDVDEERNKSKPLPPLLSCGTCRIEGGKLQHIGKKGHWVTRGEREREREDLAFHDSIIRSRSEKKRNWRELLCVLFYTVLFEKGGERVSDL